MRMFLQCPDALIYITQNGEPFNVIGNVSIRQSCYKKLKFRNDVNIVNGISNFTASSGFILKSSLF
jgi:hypothetical protein